MLLIRLLGRGLGLNPSWEWAAVQIRLYSLRGRRREDLPCTFWWLLRAAPGTLVPSTGGQRMERRSTG